MSVPISREPLPSQRRAPGRQAQTRVEELKMCLGLSPSNRSPLRGVRALGPESACVCLDLRPPDADAKIKNEKLNGSLTSTTLGTA